MTDLRQALLYNRLQQQVGDTSQVNAGATLTTGQFSTSNCARITGTIFADQAGTLTVQQSSDGTNYDTVTTQNTTASSTGAGSSFSVEVVAPYAQVLWKNTGAAATTTKRLYAFTRSV